jgi:hypothetical protein
MKALPVLLIPVLLLAAALPSRPGNQAATGPDTVIVRAGALTLHGFLWHPTGEGPSPRSSLTTAVTQVTTPCSPLIP